MGVVSPTARAHPHRESCLFGDDVVDTTHLVWLVVAPIVGFCEHLRGRCGVFSVQGSCFFRSMCLRDRSAGAGSPWLRWVCFMLRW